MNKISLCLLTIILGTCMVLPSLSSAVTTGINDVSNEEDALLKYHYIFSPPIITEMSDAEHVHQIHIEGVPLTNEYLQPRIPVKPLTLLLPYGTSMKSITIETSNKKVFDNINLEKGGTVLILSQQSGLSNTGYFQTSSYQPYENNRIYTVVGTHVLRGYTILHINIFPVQYHEQENKVDFFKYINVSVHLSPSTPVGSLRNCERDSQYVTQIVDNPEVLDTYEKRESTSNLKNEYEYVIITNNKMKQAQGEYTFQDLINYKESKGITATIVTIEEIRNNPDFTVDGIWGDNNLENPFITEPIQEDTDLFDDAQARIRNFIRYAYMTWGTRYVLLAGDSDTNDKKDIIVPHRGLFADEQGLPLNTNLNYERDDLPSDVYYACLDGNFNDDEDGHFGEAAKFNFKNNTVDEADLYAEVSVGRACVDSEEEVSNFVKKSISYDDLFYDEYIKRVLFLGEHLGSAFYFHWGGKYKDLIEYLFPSEYNITKLYHEDDSLDSEYYWYLLNEHPPHIINHDGHGSPTTALGLDCRMIEDITNDKYYFIYSHTCLAGSFDNFLPPNTYFDIDCIAEYFTVETEHGAIGAIMNSRYGLGSQKSPESPSGLYDESFFKAVFEKDIQQFGPANHYSKEDHIWRIDENGMRWAFYETNLFGDPELSFKDPSPDVTVSVEITQPIEEGVLYIDDGDPIPLSFLELPWIMKGITINLDAETDPIGLLESVEFRIDNETVHMDSEFPYEYYWNNEDFGIHTIQAIASSSYGSHASDMITAGYLW